MYYEMNLNSKAPVRRLYFAIELLLCQPVPMVSKDYQCLV